jgi:UDP-2-acetamido-3-amino-2,3-dideoxy-glucuronate N-acetyltransferase
MNDGVYIHPQALCESEHVGSRTRISAFAHVLSGAVIGEDCNVCDGVFVENAARIGDRVTIKCGVQIWDGVTLEDDVFVGPNATFTNDLMPRSRKWHGTPTPTIVEAGASIGANATVLAGVTIGRDAMVGAGSVVTKSVPSNAVVVGNPARIVDYVDAVEYSTAASTVDPTESGDVGVGGVRLLTLPRVADLRGELTVGELSKLLPFSIARYFTVFNVPSKHVRGEHAHQECHQFLTCLHGGLTVMVDDGRRRARVRLDRPELGLHLPPMTWGVQFEYTADAVLLVLASHAYDSNDYIRDYDEFVMATAGDVE